MPRKKKKHLIFENPKIKIVFIVFLAVLLGLVHGLYASAEKDHKHIIDSGEDICHGKYSFGSFVVDSDDQFVSMIYKVVLNKGSLNLILYKPNGDIYYNITDKNSIFRQNMIKINNNTEKGTWNYIINCNKADMIFDLEFLVRNSKNKILAKIANE